MKATFNDFLTKAPNYNSFAGNPDAIHIFEEILSKDENIISMIDFSEAGKLALAACIEEVENFYTNQANPTFHLTNNFTKQALGTMVRVILEPFGYLPKNQKEMPKRANAKFVKSSMLYEKSGPATLQVVRKIEKIK